MAHSKLMISCGGLAILAACSTTPEPICDRDVQIDKYGNVQLAECDDSDTPGAVARGPFPFDFFSPSGISDDERRERRERREDARADSGIPVVLAGGGGDPAPFPTDTSDDGTPSQDETGSDEDDETPSDGDAPTDSGSETPADNGDGTPTDGGSDTPSGGGDENPTTGDGGGDNSSTPNERKELHHALREAKQERSALNSLEVEVREKLEQTTDRDEQNALRQQIRSLRNERRELQAIEDERREEFDSFIASQSN